MPDWRPLLSALSFALLLLLLYSQLVLVLNPNESFFAVHRENKKLNQTLVYRQLSYLPNANYTMTHVRPSRFTIGGSRKLFNLTRSVLTIPSILGYPKKLAKRIFPKFRYPSCARRTPINPASSVRLDYKRNRLFMRCPGAFKGKYVIGPMKGVRLTDNVQLMRKWVVRSYHRPVKIKKNIEFVIASCQRSSRRFELHQHIARFKPAVKKRAIRIMKKIQGQTGIIKKPMVMVMITVDSFSRNHFFRKLRRTVKYLNRLEKRKTWKVFDFKLHNIIGPDTVENQAEIFSNGYQGYDPDNIGADNIGPSAIWNVLAKKSFVTMFGVEACAYKMYYWAGKNPTADHVSNTFFCANYRFAGYTAEKRSGRQQRCIGSHMSHYYLMNYTLDFLSKYEGTNRWAYNHLTAAHEQSGQHAQTLDNDLIWYLKSLLRKFGTKTELVIFLMADHGMRYGNFKTGKYAIQEHRLPAFFLLSKRSFLNKIEFSYDTLAHNTLRLTTKPDIRRTVLFLANYTMGLGLSKRKTNAVNLFTEKVENSRRCEDIGIPPWYCSAYVLNSIDPRIYKLSHPKAGTNNAKEIELGRLIRRVAAQILFALNVNVYTPPGHSPGSICKKLTLQRVVMASYATLRNGDVLFKITLQVKEKLSGRFESFVMVTERPEEVPTVGEDQYLPFPVKYAGRKLMAKIVMVNRSDKYGGKCEEVVRSLNINPEHCVCQPQAITTYIENQKSQRKKSKRHKK